MIVVDTSALMAILLEVPGAADCATALAQTRNRLISAGTLAEALIVAARNKLHLPMVQLVEGLRAEIVTVTAKGALQSSEAYQRWGKGFHSAALNYGDCFSYALAKERDCLLLYIGKGFAQTDIRSALS
ncbi:ribonuclease VapC [Sphingomonas vulcanisoli]|uniref:Ribonuclease VapC n=1 Tax=Sphingomonas vulcanisoli TaxID=1658060 RepID=A0ABX0TNT3_9SPHN|nr:type II toxin-antitoxin system VapC family toxin [Sphingomonas vulcanisoli]NIJ07071.1 ribonuclease VapC [Sphingomonas vulcanisoli]